ncbi:PREDICTED: TBC1 domain family member 20 [Ceratosolen solmsi marchali]|uniref:TBC1 domain family member 20 n=1 Tax=Ceratosolen solmsi marchali TaxID=326594 RepID=A0AAJ6YM57_9HYME|nr:PREDICTED: TBC1 domain family member 20 [Ceratosolen solmsi marchali]
MWDSVSDSDLVWKNGIIPEIPVTAQLHSTEEEKQKLFIINGTLTGTNLTFTDLKRLSSKGLVHDNVRKFVWPKLLRLMDRDFKVINDLDSIHMFVDIEVYEQILKDVARSGGHMPVDTSEEDMENFQKELTQIICWVLSKHEELNYYQGYNDVAATVLIVMGLQQGLYVLEKISLLFLERFMEKTMEKVNQELFYIFALLYREHPKLLEHLENVELFPHFALAEYTTWYAHKYAENRKLLHRLFDYFLGGPPLIPLYLSTKIVAYRDKEIFDTIPDMGPMFKVLSTLPDDLPFEDLLNETLSLYEQYPPKSIDNDVRDFDSKRKLKEQEWKKKLQTNVVNRIYPKFNMYFIKPQFFNSMNTYKAITVVTVVAFGLYSMLKSS